MDFGQRYKVVKERKSLDNTQNAIILYWDSTESKWTPRMGYLFLLFLPVLFHPTHFSSSQRLYLWRHYSCPPCQLSCLVVSSSWDLILVSRLVNHDVMISSSLSSKEWSSLSISFLFVSFFSCSCSCVSRQVIRVFESDSSHLSVVI